MSAWAREWHEEYVSRDLLPRHVMLETHKAEKSILPEAADKHLEAAVTNPYNFPLMHDDLWDLPPAFILTEEYDVLRDEGMMYARRLNQSGNVVVHVHDRPGWHGMFNFMAPPFNYRHAHRMTDEIVRFINSINNVFWKKPYRTVAFSRLGNFGVGTGMRAEHFETGIRATGILAKAMFWYWRAQTTHLKTRTPLLFTRGVCVLLLMHE